VRFGRPFRYRSNLKRAAHDQLRLMTDEAMYILAALLPEAQRGVYSDLAQLLRTLSNGYNCNDPIDQMML